MDKYWYLKNHKLFDVLKEEEVEKLCIVSNMKNIAKDNIVFFNEVEYKRVFIIKQGTIKICKEDFSGKEIITELLTEGDFFGQFDDAFNLEDSYAKAVSNEVKLCYFEAENFREILKNNPELSLNFSKIINNKMLSFQQKYESLIFKDVDTRVKEFFKRYAQHHATIKNNKVEMDMMLTHQDIADYVASSRQSVTTIINSLIEKGLIIYDGRKKVVIPDWSKL